MEKVINKEKALINTYTSCLYFVTKYKMAETTPKEQGIITNKKITLIHEWVTINTIGH